MNKTYIKKGLAVAVILLFIGVTFTPSINAKLGKTAFESKSTDLVHLFSFVESGYVEHRNVNVSGFNFSLRYCFCIGSVELDLLGFREEPRLTIKGLTGKTIYEYDISVSLEGFIGWAQPTGHMSGGFLKGLTVITRVTPI